MAIYDASKDIQAELDGHFQVRQFKNVAKAIERYFEIIESSSSIKSLSPEPRGGSCTPDPGIRERANRTLSALTVCMTLGLLPDDERHDRITRNELWALQVVYGDRRPIWVVCDELSMSEQRCSLYLGRVLNIIRKRMNRRGLLRYGGLDDL